VRSPIEFLQPDEAERMVGEACRMLETTGLLVKNEVAKRRRLDAGAIAHAARIRIPRRSDALQSTALAPGDVPGPR